MTPRQYRLLVLIDEKYNMYSFIIPANDLRYIAVKKLRNLLEKLEHTECFNDWSIDNNGHFYQFASDRDILKYFSTYGYAVYDTIVKIAR